MSLNLLRLLVQNRIAEFHTELELIPDEIQAAPEVVQVGGSCCGYRQPPSLPHPGAVAGRVLACVELCGDLSGWCSLRWLCHGGSHDELWLVAPPWLCSHRQLRW